MASSSWHHHRRMDGRISATEIRLAKSAANKVVAKWRDGAEALNWRKLAASLRASAIIGAPADDRQAHARAPSRTMNSKLVAEVAMRRPMQHN